MAFVAGYVRTMTPCGVAFCVTAIVPCYDPEQTLHIVLGQKYDGKQKADTQGGQSNRRYQGVQSKTTHTQSQSILSNAKRLSHFQAFIRHVNPIKLPIIKLSIGALCLLLLIMLCPATSNGADATGESMARATTTAKITLQSSISLALQNQVNVDLIPNRNGVFSSATAIMGVATNNSSGYGIYLGTASGSQNLTLAGHDDAFIAPVTGSVSAADFPTNHWGYRLVNTTDSTNDDLYQAVPGDTTQVENVTSADSTTGQNDNYELSFGVKADTSLAAGVYSNQIIVSVVANPREIEGIADLVYMQEMTPEICQSLKDLPATQQTGRLIDERDGKSYWVAYLADGNCWMTQNLDLDLSTDQTLTPNDTDITKAWTPTTSTYQGMTAVPSSTRDRSWDFGSYVVATPDLVFNCQVKASQSIDACTNLQLVDDSWGSMNAGNWTWGSYEGFVAAITDSKLYDAHYLIGNFYQFGAATAGTGQTINTGTASGSICPKGWRLPSIRTYATMLSPYGLTSSLTGTGVSSNPITANKSYHLLKDPIHVVRSGFININDTTLMNIGTDAWLNTPNIARAGATSYVFSVTNGTEVSTNSSYYLDFGFNIRCIAK